MSTPGERPGGLPDPLQFWRDLYQQSEAAWGKALEQTMNTESFAAMIGQTLDAHVSYQKMLRDSMSRYLESMNLPSRDDFSRVATHVVALEAKIDELDEKIDDLQDRLNGRDEQLERLRATLEARDRKLDALLERLESDGRALTSGPDTPTARSGKKG